MLDSGVDFTHAYLGGPGTGRGLRRLLRAATPARRRRGDAAPTLFGPNAPKVKGGYDFVGETGPTNTPPRAGPEPDRHEGHGTHVSDIAAGRSADGTHKGIAPGADLYALKVCSSVATVLQRRGASCEAHRLGAGPQRRRRHLRCRGHHQPVPRQPDYGQEQDDPTARDRQHGPGRRRRRGLGRQRRRPARSSSAPRRPRRGRSAWPRPRCRTTSCTPIAVTPRRSRATRQHHPQLQAADLVTRAHRDDHRTRWPGGRAPTPRGLRPPRTSPASRPARWR